jgi:tetratricopeptide (TPR) repeat protein
MFCKNCGKELNNSVKFCANCGAAISVAHVSNVEVVQNPAQAVALAMRAGKKENWLDWRKAIGILALLVVIGWKIYAAMDSDAVDSNNSAVSAYDSGNSQQAINQFQQASQDAVSNETKLSTLKNLAYVYSSEGRTSQAISSFQQALDLTTQGSLDYYLITGEVALLQNDPATAVTNYNKAYNLDSNDFQTNNALALFYLDIGGNYPQYVDYPKALTHAQRAVQKTDLELVKQNLGIAYYFNENYPMAISTLGGISLHKDSYTAYWLGLAYARNDDTANAKVYLRKAIANGVEVPQEVHDYLNNY